MKYIKKTFVEYSIENFSLFLGRDFQEDLDEMSSNKNLSYQDVIFYVDNILYPSIYNNYGGVVNCNKTGLIETVYSMVVFNRNKIIYNITDNLHTKLYYTVIKKIEGVFIKSPIESFTLILPSRCNIYCSSDAVITSVMVSNKNINGINNFNFLCIDETHNYIPIALNLKSGDVVKQIKNQLDERFESYNEYQKKGVYKCISYVLNFILYLNSSNIDEENVKNTLYLKSSKKIKKLKNKSKYSYINIGSNTKLDPKIKKYYQTERNSISVVKWIVRGHWRKQPYGENNSCKKTIWIEPYYKGSDLESNIDEKIFKVK